MSGKKKNKKGKSSISTRFDNKDVVEKRSLIKIYEDFLSKVDIEKSPRDINNGIIKSSLSIMLTVAFVILFFGYNMGAGLIDTLIPLTMFVSISLGILSYIIMHLAFLAFLELKLLKRVREIEEHLPDFLQLASVNISAGLPVDKALWLSVRSKFGILTYEIEKIAKETVAGEDLDVALQKLADKYDSSMLKESVNLINEGIRSGGELSELLNKISENIYETRLMRKEISASVMTYAIFIGVGSIVAAPLLLALSTQLLTIVNDITGDIDFDTSGGFQSFSFDTSGVSILDFQIFSVVIIFLTSLFSASIVNVIRKGSVKEDFKLIPIFILIALCVYFFSNLLFDRLMGGFI